MIDRPRVAVILDASRAADRLVIGGIAQFVRERAEAGRPAGAWSLCVGDEPLRTPPALASWRGGGIIATVDDRRVAMALSEALVPVVGVGGDSGRHRPAPAFPQVRADHAAIGQIGAEHLLACGLPAVAFYGGTAGWSGTRAETFRDAAAAAGRRCHVFPGGRGDARSREPKHEALVAWLNSLPKPLGVMACDDLRARHVLEACEQLGLAVPADVAVLGVGNDDVLCALMPSLSSVDASAGRVGYEAAALLERMMTAATPEQAAVVTSVVVPPAGVVARVSTDTLASDDAAAVEMLRTLRGSPWRKPPVAPVAARLGMSQATLENRFQAAFGRSIHAEFTRRRMERLRGLLIETDLPLKTIAVRAGFPSLQYMTTFVRRHAGITPARLRAMTPAPHQARSKRASISTATLPGSEPTPMELRTPMP